MTGQVLDYSIQTNEGIISGDDSQRYRFVGSDWPGASVPVRGTLVDFDIADGNRAVSIYLAEPSAPPAVPQQTAVSQQSAPVVAVPTGNKEGWKSARWIQILTRKRVTNGLLWGGLAAFLIGMVTCAAGTCAGAAAVFDPSATVQDAEAAGSAAGVGIWILVIGVLAAITGAAGKMIASFRSTED